VPIGVIGEERRVIGAPVHDRAVEARHRADGPAARAHRRQVAAEAEAAGPGVEIGRAHV